MCAYICIFCTRTPFHLNKNKKKKVRINLFRTKLFCASYTFFYGFSINKSVFKCFKVSKLNLKQNLKKKQKQKRKQIKQTDKKKCVTRHATVAINAHAIAQNATRAVAVSATRSATVIAVKRRSAATHANARTAKVIKRRTL